LFETDKEQLKQYTKILYARGKTNWRIRTR
jgi:hypothetical protein